jgi:hypothetical protein
MTVSNQVRFGQLLYNGKPYAESRGEFRQAMARNRFHNPTEIEQGFDLIKDQVDTLNSNGIDVSVADGHNKKSLALNLTVAGKQMGLTQFIDSESAYTPLSVVHALDTAVSQLKYFASDLNEQLGDVTSKFLAGRREQLEAEAQAAAEADNA